MKKILRWKWRVTMNRTGPQIPWQRRTRVNIVWIPGSPHILVSVLLFLNGFYSFKDHNSQSLKTIFSVEKKKTPRCSKYNVNNNRTKSTQKETQRTLIHQKYCLVPGKEYQESRRNKRQRQQPGTIPDLAYLHWERTGAPPSGPYSVSYLPQLFF